MRENHKRKIILFLAKAANKTADFAEIYFSSGYGQTYRAMRKALGDTRDFTRKNQRRQEREQDQKRKQQCYKCVSSLERDGLLIRTGKQKHRTATLTKAGREQAKTYLNIPDYTKLYIKEKSDYPILIAFDIPEKYRGKRDWLRAKLYELEFEPIQKSVWIGNTKLPEEFIEDISTIDLLRYTNFFSINKEIHAS